MFAGGTSGVTSTTVPFCPLPPNLLDGDGHHPSNFGINPFADPTTYNAINRLLSGANAGGGGGGGGGVSGAPPPAHTQHSNVQPVHPYRKEDDWSNN